jgi:hypothetical protein
MHYFLVSTSIHLDLLPFGKKVFSLLNIAQGLKASIVNTDVDQSFISYKAIFK